MYVKHDLAIRAVMLPVLICVEYVHKLKKLMIFGGNRIFGRSLILNIDRLNNLLAIN